MRSVLGQMGLRMPSNMQPMLGFQGPGTSVDAQHQLFEAQQHQVVNVAREKEMFRNFEQQQFQVFNINKTKTSLAY